MAVRFLRRKEKWYDRRVNNRRFFRPGSVWSEFPMTFPQVLDFDPNEADPLAFGGNPAFTGGKRNGEWHGGGIEAKDEKTNTTRCTISYRFSFMICLWFFSYLTLSLWCEVFRVSRFWFYVWFAMFINFNEFLYDLITCTILHVNLVIINHPWPRVEQTRRLLSQVVASRGG